MNRASLIVDLAEGGVTPLRADSWSFSTWKGYMEDGDERRLQVWFDEGGPSSPHPHASAMYPRQI